MDCPYHYVLKALRISSDLTAGSLDEAMEIHKKAESIPKRLLVSTLDDLKVATILMHDHIESFMVTLIPELPTDTWLLLGDKVVVYSEGA